jgi:hypothetical protein
MVGGVRIPGRLHASRLSRGVLSRSIAPRLRASNVRSEEDNATTSPPRGSSRDRELRKRFAIGGERASCWRCWRAPWGAQHCTCRSRTSAACAGVCAAAALAANRQHALCASLACARLVPFNGRYQTYLARSCPLAELARCQAGNPKHLDSLTTAETRRRVAKQHWQVCRRGWDRRLAEQGRAQPSLIAVADEDLAARLTSPLALDGGFDWCSHGFLSAAASTRSCCLAPRREKVVSQRRGWIAAGVPLPSQLGLLARPPPSERYTFGCAACRCEATRTHAV